MADRLRGRVASGTEIMVRSPQLQFLEEDLVELAVVILPGVDEDVIKDAIQGCHHARQPDDLGPSPDDRQHLEARHGQSGIG